MDVQNVRMMQRKEVCNILGTSSAGLYRGMKDKRFPKPYSRQRTNTESLKTSLPDYSTLSLNSKTYQTGK